MARARVKNGGASSSTSSSRGSAQNPHTEEHTVTNNPNEAPMPLQDNQHASSENSGQIYHGQSGSSPVSYTHLTLPTNREV